MSPLSLPASRWFAGVFPGLVFAIGFATPAPAYGGNDKHAPQVEYIAPDGKSSSISAANPAAHESNATFVDNNTVSCALKEGETTFIIELPKDLATDRFTFLNVNAAACGELRIAVSDSPLPADSQKWTQVDGIVPFAHKRLFNLSMLGVEKKFVRLSFRVDGEDEKSVQLSNPFQASLLAEAINSNFAKLRGQARELNLAVVSVAPLPARVQK